MLWLFHVVMFVLSAAFGVPALIALGDGDWQAAAVWGALAVLVLGIEILVFKVLPWFLGRDPYEGWRDSEDAG